MHIFTEEGKEIYCIFMARGTMANIITLLAGSDQWEGFVGSVVNAEKIDKSILGGNLGDAANYLRYYTDDVLDAHLERVAIQARKGYLRGVHRLS